MGEERRFICSGIALSALCKLRPGWRGKSERLAVASRSPLASADRVLLPRDVWGDTVGVTSVLLVVPSGRDVRA